jgi:hypothetical protein
MFRHGLAASAHDEKRPIFAEFIAISHADGSGDITSMPFVQIVAHLDGRCQGK